MKNRKNVIFGFVLGVICTIVFGLAVASINDTTSYEVVSTDDHGVLLYSEHGTELELQFENVPEGISCFQPGAIIIIEW